MQWDNIEKRILRSGNGLSANLTILDKKSGKPSKRPRIEYKTFSP